MDYRLLERNSISIISSPNKQFYCMAAVDLSDGDFLGDLSNVENVDSRSDQITDGNVKDSCDALMISYCDDRPQDFLKWRSTQSDSVDSFACTPRHSVDSVNRSPCYGSLSYSDLSSQSLSIASQDSTVRQSSWISPEDPSDVGKGVVARDVCLADLFCPISMQNRHHRSEGQLNTRVEKSRASPRKCVRKSKSDQHNSSGFAKKMESELFSEMSFLGIDNSRRRISENCNKLKCKGERRSLPLTDNLAQNGTRQWKPHGTNGDVESSVNGFPTSDSTKMTSAGQDSANIDQEWDGYQAPLYEAISDDSTEEKLDASCLQADWQSLADEFFSFSDFGNDNICHQTCHSSDQDTDTDTDTEELHCFITESNKALRLTKASLAAAITSRNQRRQKSSSIKELLATCETNIACLKNLLVVVDQREWDVHDISHLSELVKQWEDVGSHLHQLTSSQNISNLKSASDIIIDLSPVDDDNDDVTICKETNIYSTEANADESGSTTSAICHSQSNGFFIPNRFDSKLYSLFDEGSLALQSSLMSIQPLFFVLLILFIVYLFIYRRCFVNVMDIITLDPQLRYVIGSPPA